MSYTKGPYNAYIEEGLPVLISGKDDLGGLHIATIHTASGSVELPVEANARLFKAAPDMLAALIKAASVFEDLRHCKLTVGDRALLGSAPVMRAQDACYEAIAKAEGS